MKESDPIIKAIEKENVKLFSELFSKLNNKQERFEYGEFPDWSLLHIAAENKKAEIIETLFQLEPNFPVDIQDKEKRTPLHRAIIKENISTVKLLLKKGANPNGNMRDPIFEEVLMPILVSVIHRDLELFDLIIENGGNANFTIPEGNLFFYIAAENTKEEEAFKIAKKLISNGVDLNHSAENDGLRPINLPIEMGYLSLVKLYVENGADLNFKDKNGDSPFVFAMKKNQKEIVNYLSSVGAELTALDIMNNIEINFGSEDDEDDDEEREIYSYQLIFTGVDESICDELEYDFEQYSWEIGFHVVESETEYDSEKNVFIINFTSYKYFIYNEIANNDSLDTENPNHRPLEKNIYYRLVGKEQYFHNLILILEADLDDEDEDEESDLRYDEVFFVDDKNQIWLCEIGRYSEMIKVENESDQNYEESRSEKITLFEKHPKEFTNSLGMEFILIPAGEFLMGAVPQDERAEDEEKPQHKVRITKPFYIGKYPVTQEEWERLMGNNPSDYKEAGKRAPVESVSWDDCQEYIEKLKQKEGKVYRLPTEAEWEYAARGKTTTNPSEHYFYTYGNDELLLGDYAWYSDNSGNTTHPVGEKKPNGFGLYDVMGNVYEWCEDWFYEGYYNYSPLNDPKLTLEGMYHRVQRGSSCIFNARFCRLSFRSHDAPFGQDSGSGFRLVLLP